MDSKDISSTQSGIGDDALVQKAATGDKFAYGQLIQTWQSQLWRIARRYTGDAGEAEDIVQDVFVALWRRINEMGALHNVGGYLRKATLNACRDWSRRRAVRSFFFGASPIKDHETTITVTPHADPHEADLERLDKLVASLPIGLKEPLILCALNGLSHKDAAVTLGISPKAIENRIARARMVLREKWSTRN